MPPNSVVQACIDQQQGEQIADDSRFPIDNPPTPRLQAEGRSVTSRRAPKPCAGGNAAIFGSWRARNGPRQKPRDSPHQSRCADRLRRPSGQGKADFFLNRKDRSPSTTAIAPGRAARARDSRADSMSPAHPCSDCRTRESSRHQDGTRSIPKSRVLRATKPAHPERRSHHRPAATGYVLRSTTTSCRRSITLFDNTSDLKPGAGPVLPHVMR